MKRLALIIPMLIVLSAALTACSTETQLRFTNESECGAATIALTNMDTGNIDEFTVEEGDSHEVDLDPMVEYHYEVTYPRMANSIQCESKRVTTMVEEGQSVNVSLTSVLDENLINATATAEAAATGDDSSGE